MQLLFLFRLRFVRDCLYFDTGNNDNIRMCVCVMYCTYSYITGIESEK